ncbi:MAG: hypothetical protein CMM73_02620 [Rhodospirillaceae bacterium]|nr:hypothetical protein [Rhodospirillaceae bacterium]|tara:strand:+ start:133 stop:474 length:342 start_codon:yes stop_codon:yes gene_type:complete
MLTRLAIFHGRVRDGQDTAMRRYVEDVLAPLWRQFDGAEEVRVMYGVEQDDGGPEIPLILAITYLDRAAMSRALDSPARYESRDLLPGFFETYLNGSLHHYLMDTDTDTDSGS